MQHLRGELSLEQAIVAAQQGHRNYAKRQMTWFRREPEVHWITEFGSDATVQKRVVEVIRAEAQDMKIGCVIPTRICVERTSLASTKPDPLA